MVYRKGELSKAMMDRQWPHQVALPAYRCHGHNDITIRLFCESLSPCPRTHSFRRDDQDMIVFCFAVRDHAEKFREHFGGEFLDPKDRPKWPGPRTRRTDISLEDRHRNGRCENCATKFCPVSSMQNPPLSRSIEHCPSCFSACVDNSMLMGGSNATH